MRNFRLLVTIFATICMLALGAYALANRPPLEGGDDIIIKGGSMQIQCGANHGKDCLSHTAGSDTYTHKKNNAHITHVTIKDSAGAELYSSDFSPSSQPTVAVTFK
jgi:hypothetical protein